MQFCWNLQLLTCYSLFRNRLCFTDNLLTFELDRISVTLNTSGVTWTIALDILSFFGQVRTCCWSSLQNKVFIVFMVRWFFLLRHFLVVEDYELSQRKRYVRSVTLTLEYVRTLSWSLFSYTNSLPNDVLCEIAIQADETTLNSSFDEASDSS